MLYLLLNLIYNSVIFYMCVHAHYKRLTERRQLLIDKRKEQFKV